MDDENKYVKLFKLKFHKFMSIMINFYFTGTYF